MSTFANTTILSNFASVGRLDLLRRLYNTLHISVEVYAEIQEGLDEGYTFYSAVEPLVHPVVSNGWIHLTALIDAELPLFSQVPARLHKGEAVQYCNCAPSQLAVSQRRSGCAQVCSRHASPCHWHHWMFGVGHRTRPLHNGRRKWMACGNDPTGVPITST